jgi:flagellar motility protein MotE (MotC chaperone)
MKKWVKIYEAMVPEQAGQIIQDLDPAFAKELLATMDARRAGKILNTIPADKAIRLGDLSGSVQP